jgi:hypothetical protein
MSDKENKMIKKAVKRFKENGMGKLMKKDYDELFDYIRPNYMIDSDVFKNEVKKRIDKWRFESEKKCYNDYERKVLSHNTSKFYELMYMAYMTMAR